MKKGSRDNIGISEVGGVCVGFKWFVRDLASMCQSHKSNNLRICLSNPLIQLMFLCWCIPGVEGGSRK